jgi:hypothetical protein
VAVAQGQGQPPPPGTQPLPPPPTGQLSYPVQPFPYPPSGGSYPMFPGSYSYTDDMAVDIQIFIYNEHPAASLFLHSFEDVAFSNDHTRVDQVAKPGNFIETS